MHVFVQYTQCVSSYMYLYKSRKIGISLPLNIITFSPSIYIYIHTGKRGTCTCIAQRILFQKVIGVLQFSYDDIKAYNVELFIYISVYVHIL